MISKKITSQTFLYIKISLVVIRILRIGTTLYLEEDKADLNFFEGTKEEAEIAGLIFAIN